MYIYYVYIYVYIMYLYMLGRGSKGAATHAFQGLVAGEASKALSSNAMGS